MIYILYSLLIYYLFYHHYYPFLSLLLLILFIGINVFDFYYTLPVEYK